MRVLHVVSNEILFAYQDSLGNFLSPGTTLVSNTLYKCHRFVPGVTGYVETDLYGMELQAL